VVGLAAGTPAMLRSNYLLIKNIAAVGLHWSDYRDRTPALVRDAQQEIFALWRQGLLASPITDVLRLDEAALALRKIADRQVRGKIVLLTERYAARRRPSPDSGRGQDFRR
jgi:NADPH:quinone reductase